MTTEPTRAALVAAAELKACPFCGGKAALVSNTSSTVLCQNNQCIIGDPAPFNNFTHRADAIAAWNHRASSDRALAELREENERLKKERDEARKNFGVALETGARFENALRFYADVSKYPAPLTGGMGALWSDCGTIARAALKGSPA